MLESFGDFNITNFNIYKFWFNLGNFKYFKLVKEIKI